MKTTKLPPKLEQQRLAWVSLLRKMHEQYSFDKWKDQLSPSFEYRNWRSMSNIALTLIPSFFDD